MPCRPNILVIVADQLAWRALPMYGDTYAQTPNIDRIAGRAGRAVRFTDCYTPCPLCQPARAAFWTSRYPHETGVLSNARKHYVPGVARSLPTLGDLFADAGYTTRHVGKRHDAGSLRGFDLAPIDGIPVDAQPAWPVNYDTLQDRYATTSAVEWLHRYDGEAPYLTVVDLQNPHNICGWVGENAGEHRDVPVDVPLPPLPANFEDADLDRRPRPVQYVCCSHNRLSQAGPWNEKNYRHYLAAYYHYLSRLDSEIGLVLDALERRDDASSTIVVFTADHGDGMASHRMVTKQVSFIEETTHVPFMVAGPDALISGDREVTHPISLLDLLPTLCDLGSVPAEDGFRGGSLRPWLQGEPAEAPHPYVVSEWHTEWGFTISPGRMLRTDRYKYTRYLEGDGEELYDLAEDRGETHTLAHDPAYADVLTEHRHLLDQQLAVTDDPFYSLSWVVDPRWRSHTVGYHNHRGPAAPMVGITSTFRG